MSNLRDGVARRRATARCARGTPSRRAPAVGSTVGVAAGEGVDTVADDTVLFGERARINRASGHSSGGLSVSTTAAGQSSYLTRPTPGDSCRGELSHAPERAAGEGACLPDVRRRIRKPHLNKRGAGNPERGSWGAS